MGIGVTVFDKQLDAVYTHDWEVGKFILRNLKRIGMQVFEEAVLLYHSRNFWRESEERAEALADISSLALAYYDLEESRRVCVR